MIPTELDLSKPLNIDNLFIKSKKIIFLRWNEIIQTLQKSYGDDFEISVEKDCYVEIIKSIGGQKNLSKICNMIDVKED